ncbi:MAG: hypothetical protein IKY09_02580 [Methanocorpusculum sp.]|nr:hypothetical protein [Methanocorpusculum sp.]MBR5450199.1 hypothetical protein [Methanocorpusculum sp.]
MVASITEYKSYFEAGEDMTDEEYGQYMRAIHNFAYNDIEPDYSKLTPLVKAALRTVIASVRKNKEDRENGSKGGRPARVSTENKPGFSENEKGGYFFAETNVKENVNVNVNENVNTDTEPEAEKAVCVPSSPKKGVGKLQQDIFDMVSEHNKTAKQGRKVPVSGNFWNFTCKEMRELLDTVGVQEPLETIKAAFANFLKVAKSDTWQKSFTWRMFCSHYVDYVPEYFNLQRYLNSEPATDDATKKPENAFFFANKDNPDFHVDTFQAHIDDWKAQGRPEGADYFKLQTEWEVRKCS